MTSEEAVKYALELGFRMEFEVSGALHVVTLHGYNTTFIGLGVSQPLALEDAVNSLDRFVAPAFENVKDA